MWIIRRSSILRESNDRMITAGSANTKVVFAFVCPICTVSRVYDAISSCLYWCWCAASARVVLTLHICVCLKFSSNPKCVQLAKSYLLCKIAKSKDGGLVCYERKIKIVVAVFWYLTQKKPFQQEMLLFVCWCC